MKIIKDPLKAVSIVHVEHDGETFKRVTYSDGFVEWRPTSYDGEGGEEELEKMYQDLLSESAT